MATSYELESTLRGHESYVTTVEVLPGGHIVSASRSNFCGAAEKADARSAKEADARSLTIWDRRQRRVRTLAGHTGDISCIASMPGGGMITGSWDETIKVWANGRCVHTLEGHEGKVNCVAVLPARSAAARPESTRDSSTEPPRDGSTGNGDAGRVVSGSSDGTIKVWDITDGRCVQTLAGHKGRVRCVDVFSDGRRLVLD